MQARLVAGKRSKTEPQIAYYTGKSRPYKTVQRGKRGTRLRAVPLTTYERITATAPCATDPADRHILHSWPQVP